MKTEIYHCCEFNCKNSATVEIRFGNKPDDCTYSCDVHIEHLKPKDKEVFISNVHSGGANKIVDKAKEEQLTDTNVGQLNNKPELKLSDKIGHLNCDPEALKDPKFVEAMNTMAELAYKHGKEMKPLDSDLYKIADKTFKRLQSLKPTSLNTNDKQELTDREVDQELFNYLDSECGFIALESNLHDIKRIVRKFKPGTIKDNSEHEEEITAQKVLDSKDLHWTYYPNGDSSKELIHDRDCKFCNVEDRVLEAMEEYTELKLQQLNTQKQQHAYTYEEVEALLNKFCNEVMVGQSLGTIERSSNGISKYIIDNFKR